MLEQKIGVDLPEHTHISQAMHWNVIFIDHVKCNEQKVTQRPYGVRTIDISQKKNVVIVWTTMAQTFCRRRRSNFTVLRTLYLF